MGTPPSNSRRPNDIGTCSNHLLELICTGMGIFYTTRPREMSSKQPVSRFRQVIPVQKHEIRDPRFDERTGQLNIDLFRKSYSFLDDMKVKEKTLVKKEAKKARNPVKKAKLQRLLQQMASIKGISQVVF